MDGFVINRGLLCGGCSCHPSQCRCLGPDDPRPGPEVVAELAAKYAPKTAEASRENARWVADRLEA